MAFVDDLVVLVDDGNITVNGSAEGTYSVTTERIYRRLPEYNRILDAQNGMHLKKFISAIGDQLNEIDQLVARLEYIPINMQAAWVDSLNQYNTYERPPETEDDALGFAPIYATSDLFDGRTADDAWLGYIGQTIGADIASLPTEAERRDAAIYNYLGFKAGSRQALRSAATRVLTGDKFVRVYPHRDGAGGDVYSVGTEWDILIVTKATETPGGSASILAEIEAKGAAPAGVVVHCVTYTASWDDIESTFTTWNSVDASLSWDNLETGNPDDLPI